MYLYVSKTRTPLNLYSIFMSSPFVKLIGVRTINVAKRATRLKNIPDRWQHIWPELAAANAPELAGQGG